MVIPHFPTLSIKTFFKKPHRLADLSFPLSSERAVFYYLARNAVAQAIDVLALKPGDEVLMPAYNSGVEVQPFLAAGVSLKYYDINQDLSLPLEKLPALMTKQTRALFLIHLWGFPVNNFKESQEFAQKNNLYLIEDCALSFLSQYHGRPLGSFGDVAIFSLRKSLPIPNGGVLVVNNKDLPLPVEAEKPRSTYSTLIEFGSLILENWTFHCSCLSRFRDFTRHLIRRVVTPHLGRIGIDKVSAGILKFEVDKAGWSMSRISLAVIKRLNYQEIAARRRHNYESLARRLEANVPAVKLLWPRLPDGAVPLFLPLLTDDNQALVQHLQKNNIGAGLWWQDFPYLKNEQEYLTLHFLKNDLVEVPIYQDLGEKEINHIFAVFFKFFDKKFKSGNQS